MAALHVERPWLDAEETPHPMILRLLVWNRPEPGEAICPRPVGTAHQASRQQTPC